jgi:hypothetical protein
MPQAVVAHKYCNMYTNKAFARHLARQEGISLAWNLLIGPS